MACTFIRQTIFFRINHYLKPVSKVALLHRFYCMGKVKRKSALEHAQNVQIQIILRMRNVYASLVSIRSFCSSQWFC